jgi:hypothetical protein
MAEPTLALKLTDIQAKLGVFAGWGRGTNFGEPAWNTQQQAILDDCTQSGLRRFYWPTAAEGETTSYDWSFLKPTANLALASGAQTIPLPDDFGGFEGQITVLTTASTSQPWQIQWRSEGEIRRMYSLTPTVTGPTAFAATQPLKGTTGTQSQRFQLFVFPAADQAYTLQVQYYINPDYLDGAFPYAYGGPQHAETVLESCLALLEERIDDQSTVHADAFSKRLTASISMDRKLKPQQLGYNRDNSDGRHWNRSDSHYWAPAATYNGSSFS